MSGQLVRSRDIFYHTLAGQHQNHHTITLRNLYALQICTLPTRYTVAHVGYYTYLILIIPQCVYTYRLQYIIIRINIIYCPYPYIALYPLYHRVMPIYGVHSSTGGLYYYTNRGNRTSIVILFYYTHCHIIYSYLICHIRIGMRAYSHIIVYLQYACSGWDAVYVYTASYTHIQHTYTLQARLILYMGIGHYTHRL